MPVLNVLSPNRSAFVSGKATFSADFSPDLCLRKSNFLSGLSSFEISEMSRSGVIFAVFLTIVLACTFAIAQEKRFRWVRLERPGRLTPSATSKCWGVRGRLRALPGYRASVKLDRKMEGKIPLQIQLEILESTLNHEAVYKCSAKVEDGREVVELGGNPSEATRKFKKALGVDCKSHKGGPTFFGLGRKDVKKAMENAARLPPTPDPEVMLDDRPRNN